MTEEMLIPDNEYWITKSGERIKYKDLTDNHLNNIANMLQEKAVKWTNYCMNRNEELDPPSWLIQAINAVNEEIRRRYNG